MRRGDWVTPVSGAARLRPLLVSSRWSGSPGGSSRSKRNGRATMRCCRDGASADDARPPTPISSSVLAERLSTASHQPQLAMANRADLATRVVSVLDSTRARGRAARRRVVAIAAASWCFCDDDLTTADRRRRAVRGQTSADTQKFDVVSIKTVPETNRRPPRTAIQPGWIPQLVSRRFVIECGTVERLISTAYVQNGEPPDQSGRENRRRRVAEGVFLGGCVPRNSPIEAKAEGTPDRKVMLGPMLRSAARGPLQAQDPSRHRRSGDVRR